MADPQIRKRPALPERTKRRGLNGERPARIPERIEEHRRLEHQGKRPTHPVERRG